MGTGGRRGLALGSSRRGATSWVYDTIISLVFVALFAVTVFTYVSAKANGEAFFSKFHAIDIATCADIANAGPGNVVLRYDNIKQNLDLTFWLTDRRIAVGRTTMTGNEPTDAVVRYYGKAQSYPQGPSRPQRPTSLLLRKDGASFAISQDLTTLDACPPLQQKAVPVTDARIKLEAPQAVKEAFSKVLAGTVIKVTDQSPTITIKMTLVTGTENKVDFQPTDADGASIACAFSQTLPSATLIDFISRQPTTGATTPGAISLDTKITATRDVALKEEDVGVALARAIINYYR